MRGVWVQFDPKVDYAPLADKSALVVYDLVSVKTDSEGRLPLTELIASDATGVTIPWQVFLRVEGKRKKVFQFLAPAGSVTDLAEATPVPEGEAEAERWAQFAHRAEAAAKRAEEVAGVDDMPSLTLLFRNRLL